MIRPFTCVCLLLAGGSGLFLYQSKHRTRVLDQQIEQTMKQVEAARSRVGILQAEWALLNDPQRLAELSDRFLSLKPVAPAQFVTLADLDRRLPAPLPPPAAVAAGGEPAAADAGPENAGPEPAQDTADASAAAPPAEPAAEAVHPRAAPSPIPVPKAVAHPAEIRRLASQRDDSGAEPRAAPARNAPAASERSRRLMAERESAAQTAPAAAPIPLWHPAAAPMLASAAPARPYSEPPPRTTRPVFGSTSVQSVPSGSLLGGAHMAVAPPVPISDAAWSGR
ncbi:MAG: hypothetical protein JO047_10210 [Alphaproteobacteria bacterium]|nr:hypothetical protein [Alphaproteobacteria bacterium]